MSIDRSEEGEQQDATKALQAHVNHLGNELVWWRFGVVVLSIWVICLGAGAISLRHDLSIAWQQLDDAQATIARKTLAMVAMACEAFPTHATVPLLDRAAESARQGRERKKKTAERKRKRAARKAKKRSLK